MKTLSIFLLSGIISLNLFAQDYKLVTDAFKTSYSLEYKAEYTKAIDALKKVYDENSYEINIRIAWLHYSAGLFTESIAYYNKALTIMPYSIEARLGIVYPMSAQGNWDQVAKQYEKILELDAANPTANYRLGLIYYGKEQYDKALEFFQKNVNFYPFTYDSLIMLAWTNFKLGKTREAKVLFIKALMYKPDDSSALEGIGLIK
jgi:tetratricopeptide (TPR) repeat protein